MNLKYFKIYFFAIVMFLITNCITYDNEKNCDKGKTAYLYLLADRERDYKNGKISASQYDRALAAGISGMLIACQPSDKKQQN